MKNYGCLFLLLGIYIYSVQSANLKRSYGKLLNDLNDILSEPTDGRLTRKEALIKDIKNILRNPGLSWSQDERNPGLSWSQDERNPGLSWSQDERNPGLSWSQDEKNPGLSWSQDEKNPGLSWSQDERNPGLSWSQDERKPGLSSWSQDEKASGLALLYDELSNLIKNRIGSRDNIPEGLTWKRSPKKGPMVPAWRKFASGRGGDAKSMKREKLNSLLQAKKSAGLLSQLKKVLNDAIDKNTRKNFEKRTNDNLYKRLVNDLNDLIIGEKKNEPVKDATKTVNDDLKELEKKSL